MGKLLLYLILGINAVSSLRKPWAGVVVAYFFVLLGPQYVWWWVFEGVRPFFMVILPVMLGFILKLAMDPSVMANLMNRQNLFFLMFASAIYISYFLGPYVDIDNELRVFEPEYVLSICNTIFIVYFIADGLISEVGMIKFMTVPMIISAIYLTYWANSQYLSGFWYGRLPGPVDIFGNGIYKDENSFAMFFVTALPFLFYWALSFRNIIVRLGIWAVIPLGWHAIFLTGSRGGLLGVGVTIVAISVRSKRKLLGLMLILAFLGIYQWQGGEVLKDRMESMQDYEQEGSAMGRLDAWNAAIRMVMDNPATGSGLGSFTVAFPYYSSKKPREAHNTFFQLIGESGLLAGFAYVFLVGGVLVGLWKNGNRLRDHVETTNDRRLLFLLNEAVFVSFFGLTVCAMFLSLQVYEIFYYLLILSNGILRVSSGLLSPESAFPVDDGTVEPRGGAEGQMETENN